MRQASGAAGAGEPRAADALEQTLQQPVAQRRQARDLAGALVAREVGGHAHADDRRQVLGAGAKARLLPAAQDDRGQANLGPHPERAGTRRPVEIVRGHREQIDHRVVHRKRQPPDDADAVHVKGHALTPGQPADLAQRLQRADLAVGRHDRDERRVGPQGAADGIGIDHTFAVHRQPRHAPALLLEVTARIADRDVLDGGGQHVAAGGPRRHAADGQVVGLGGAGGEDHAGRGSAHQPGDLGSRPIQGRPGLQPQGVQGGGVAHAPLQEWTHEGHHAGVDRREPGVVEIDPGRRAAGSGSIESFGR
jgi:hypothetical protein